MSHWEMDTKSASRTYRGATVEQRRADRKLLIMEAAIQLYGEVGFRNATVKAVCERANLTERYFYESFANSETLLIAAYTHITDALFKDMAEASSYHKTEDARVAAVLRIYFQRIKEQPRAARVFLLELAGISGAVDEARSEVLRSMHRILLGPLRNDRRKAASDKMSLEAAGMVGALLSIAIRWLSQSCSRPLTEVAHLALTFCMTARELETPGKRKKGKS